MDQSPFCYQKIILYTPYKNAQGTGVAQSEQRLDYGLEIEEWLFDSRQG